MSVIEYRLAGGRGEWISFKCDGDDRIIISFPKGTDGTLVLGNAIYPVKDGSVTLSLSSLQNADYHPNLYVGTECFPLDGFTVHKSTIIMLKTDDVAIRRLLDRIHAMENRSEELEERIKRLEALLRTEIF